MNFATPPILVASPATDEPLGGSWDEFRRDEGV